MYEGLSRPLVAIDIGNTSIALGLFSAPERPEVMRTAKIALSSKHRKADFLSCLKRLVSPGRSSARFDAVVASVVPSVARDILPALRAMADRTLVADSRLDLGFVLSVDNPKAVGADRIVNAVAAQAMVSASAAIIDCGSATTLSIVHDGKFLGGAILPGVRMMRDALREKTAKLPLVPLAPPGSSIGRNTANAIQVGILIGTVDAASGIIHRAEHELVTRFSIILTGGNAELLVPLFRRHVVHMPDLTLQGLRLLFHANS